MKNIIKAIAILTAVGTTAFTTVADDKVHHVPSTLNNLRLLTPASAKHNHVLVVNVGNAIPEKDFGFLVTVVASRLQLNFWTNSIPASPVAAMLSDDTVFKRNFGEKAKIGVLIENTGDADDCLVSPGKWCRVNLKGLADGAKDRQTVLDRQAKAIMRGVAFACGGGAVLDGRSSTHFSSFSKDGLDKVGITITPDGFFPMLEVLRRVGGGEILSPAISEE